LDKYAIIINIIVGGIGGNIVKKSKKIIAFVCCLLQCLIILFIFYNFGFMDTPIRILEGIVFSLLFPGIICFLAWMAGKMAQNKTL
jgi:hypothetical protein